MTATEWTKTSAVEDWRARKQRDRLYYADAEVARCGTCGEWMWRGKCKVPHDNILNFREEEK
ncbi:hypothetical protein HD598_002131 [Neomicrococcus aestuarii]|uniref:Uncharacterized protein n=1 Tax=Neomicrococcus aestuarii TaxID=556325 RepID=A0A7W8TV35_9MICC|nr:hypothetical protein [Neomicrococcus aestuarii]